MYERQILGLEEAQRAIQAMIEEAKVPKGSGLPMSVAITDYEGHLVCLARMDGSRDFNVSMAIRKAYTAARWRRNTTAVGELMQRRKWNVIEFGSEYTIVPGGVAIAKPSEEQVYGATYGAIGVAGRVPAAEDEAIALAGLKAIQDALWPSK
jgi:uncharacterized protein GlcG (DUF336 family)